jgi:hypothetical protein
VVLSEVPGAGLPFIAPGRDAGIHLRWSAPGKRLDVELADDGVFFSEWAGDDLGDDGDCELRDVVQRMRNIFG